MWKKNLVVVLLITSFWTPCFASSDDSLPETMVSIGDSSTAGMLAAHSRKGIWFPLRHVTVLIDSIQLLFTFNKGAFEKRSLSWSLGTKVNSHYRRLKKLNPELQAANLSVSSSKIRDVWEKQIPVVKKWSQEHAGADSPDYVTLLVGANDFCGKTYDETTSAASYEHYLHLILKELLEGSERSKVFLLPLPRIDKLAELTKEAFVLPAPKVMRCQDIWKMIPLCQTVTDATTPEKQKMLYDKIQSYNLAMKRQVDRLRSEYGDRIRLSWEERLHFPEPDYLAVDCFHPNKKAQEAMAEISWKRTWWSDNGR